MEEQEVILFRAWPKISRLWSPVTITEKIDGTNACVIVTEDGQVGAQSRSKLITPEDDNHGFARWVSEHTEELRELGPGYHFGEWWGRGINKRYKGVEGKYFSLFNTHRWSQREAPGCCSVVPVLWEGDFSERVVEAFRGYPSTMDPTARMEGVMVYFKHNGVYLKAVFDK